MAGDSPSKTGANALMPGHPDKMSTAFQSIGITGSRRRAPAG